MANLESAEVTEGKATSGRAVENLYVDSKGKTFARPTEDVVGIVKKFKDTGEQISVSLGDFPEHILRALAAFGAHQVSQNAYGAAKDTAEKIQLAEARFETLVGGDWASDRQSGPGTSILLLALIRGYEKKNGNPPSEDWIEEKRALLKDEEVAKDFAKRPAIKAHLVAIQAERTAERAAKLAAAAEADEGDDDFA